MYWRSTLIASMLAASALLVAGAPTDALAKPKNKAPKVKAPKYKATGEVTIVSDNGEGALQILEFSAFDGGEVDKGEVTYTNVDANISYTADVLCADVDPTTDTARFLIQIPDDEDESLAGLFIVFSVEDGGNPGAGNDEVSFAVYDEDEEDLAEEACETGDFSDALAVVENEVTGGNLKVHSK